jgi:hypothetical protein
MRVERLERLHAVVDERDDRLHRESLAELVLVVLGGGRLVKDAEALALCAVDAVETAQRRGEDLVDGGGGGVEKDVGRDGEARVDEAARGACLTSAFADDEARARADETECAFFAAAFGIVAGVWVLAHTLHTGGGGSVRTGLGTRGLCRGPGSGSRIFCC